MITSVPAFDLLKRLGSMPLEPLVDALRDLHQRGAADSSSLQALLTQPPATPATSAPPAPSVKAVELPAQPAGVDYEAARKHFVEHAQRLREQAILAERLLAGFATRQAAATPGNTSQHDLTLDCGRGAMSSTRFVVVNSLDQPVNLRFRVGRAHGESESLHVSEVVSFDPETAHLLPHQESVVRLSVKLSQYDGRTDVIVFGVDVLGDERFLAKLWVRLRVTAQEVWSERAQRESELTRVDLKDPTPVQVDLLHGLQRVLLTNPVACQSAFTALVAEGRRFAETPEGRAWRDRLVHSSLLRQVRLVFDLSTLGMLEERGGSELPSSYLDVLFMIAAGGDTDAVLNRVFWRGAEDHERGRSRD